MKKLLLVLAIASLNAHAYEIVGGGHVSEPIIVKNDPSFRVVEGGTEEYSKKKKLEFTKQKRLEELKKKYLHNSTQSAVQP